VCRVPSDEQQHRDGLFLSQQFDRLLNRTRRAVASVEENGENELPGAPGLLTQ
jgi:hypothetical protein